MGQMMLVAQPRKFIIFLIVAVNRGINTLNLFLISSLKEVQGMPQRYNLCIDYTTEDTIALTHPGTSYPLKFHLHCKHWSYFS